MARILLCDDSRLMQNIFKRHLEAAGHVVVGTASDGAEGYQLYTELKPDLVLLDITMPNRDGRSCLADIMKADPSAKVVMISALMDPEVSSQCLKAGARGFVLKSTLSRPDDFRLAVLDVIEPLLAAA